MLGKFDSCMRSKDVEFRRNKFVDEDIDSTLCTYDLFLSIKSGNCLPVFSSRIIEPNDFFTCIKGLEI